MSSFVEEIEKEVLELIAVKLNSGYDHKVSVYENKHKILDIIDGLKRRSRLAEQALCDRNSDVTTVIWEKAQRELLIAMCAQVNIRYEQYASVISNEVRVFNAIKSLQNILRECDCTP